MVDEYLKGVVTLQTTFCGILGLPGFLHKEAGSTIVLPKVRNLRNKQKELESSARDGESPVCQVSLTLYLQRIR